MIHWIHFSVAFHPPFWHLACSFSRNNLYRDNWVWLQQLEVSLYKQQRKGKCREFEQGKSLLWSHIMSSFVQREWEASHKGCDAGLCEGIKMKMFRQNMLRHRVNLIATYSLWSNNYDERKGEKRKHNKASVESKRLSCSVRVNMRRHPESGASERRSPELCFERGGEDRGTAIQNSSDGKTISCFYFL